MGTLDHLFVVCSPPRTALQHFQVCFLNSFGKFLGFRVLYLENWLSFDYFFFEYFFNLCIYYEKIYWV